MNSTENGRIEKCIHGTPMNEMCYPCARLDEMRHGYRGETY